MRAQDIETESGVVRQIAFYHVRESFHSQIKETLNKIYYPKLLELIQMCEVSQEFKYDCSPIIQHTNY